jgi:hypothetical protein
MSTVIQMAHPDELKKFKKYQSDYKIVVKLLARLRSDKGNNLLWGCFGSDNQPLTNAKRYHIFTFLNNPSEKQWNHIYNIQVNNKKTLWHMWRQFDNTAPDKIIGGKWDTLPSAQQLQEIIYLRRNHYQCSSQFLLSTLTQRIKTFEASHPQHALCNK